MSTQISLRLPDSLRAQIEEAAQVSGRSKNTEMVIRLEESFAKSDMDIQSAILQIQEKLDAVMLELSRLRRAVAAPRASEDQS